MLPRQNRLSQKERNAFKNGALRFQTPIFLLKTTQDQSSHPPRFAIVVKKTIDRRAVVRNRIKRVISEALKEILPSFLQNSNTLLIAQNNIKEKTRKEIQKDLHTLIRTHLTLTESSKKAREK
jgi:ribonuclease P protein component